MRFILSVSAVLAAWSLPASGRGDDKSERAAMKKLLLAAVEELDPIAKNDEKATAELKKLKESGDKELDRMADEIKAAFKLDRLDAKAVERGKKLIKAEIEAADREKLLKAIRSRDGKIAPKFCWLWGCK
jgi:hypothetical protein